MGNLKLFLSLFTVYAFLIYFGGLFGLTITAGLSDTFLGQSFDTGLLATIMDAVDFMLGFITLPITILGNTTVPSAVRTIISIVGLLNYIVLAFYVRGAGD